MKAILLLICISSLISCNTDVTELIDSHQYEKLDAHFKKHSAEINRPITKYGDYTALHVAALRYDMEAMKILIKHKANPNILTKNEESTLHLLVTARVKPKEYQTKEKAVKLLLDAGTNIELKSFSQSPLYLACVKQDEDLAKIFLKYGANPNSSDSDGMNIITSSSSSNTSFNIIKLLVDHGSKLDVKNKTNMSEVWWLFNKNKRFRSLEYILRKIYQETNKPPNRSVEFLHNSIEWDNIEMVKLLVECGTKIDTKNKSTNNETALEMATRLKRNEIIIYLETQK